MKKKEIFSRILNFFVAKISLICGEEGSRQISFCFDDIAALFTIKRLLITTAIQIFKTLLEFSSIYSSAKIQNEQFPSVSFSR